MTILRRRETPITADDLEAEIRATAPQIRELRGREVQASDYAPPAVRAMLEQPQVTAEDLGRITAEAINADYEEAAKALAELGKMLSERIAALDKLRQDAQIALRDCLDTAQSYREAGRRHAERIESTAAMTAEVRDTCEAMRKKLGPSDA